jgi:hypothetical protein
MASKIKLGILVLDCYYRKANKAKKKSWLGKPSFFSFYNQFLAIQYTNAIGDAFIRFFKQ